MGGPGCKEKTSDLLGTGTSVRKDLSDPEIQHPRFRSPGPQIPSLTDQRNFFSLQILAAGGEELLEAEVLVLF